MSDEQDDEGTITNVDAYDEDEVVRLASALQAVANDESIAINVQDYDPDEDEYFLCWDWNGKEHKAWFTTAFIREVLGPMTGTRFQVT